MLLAVIPTPREFAASLGWLDAASTPAGDLVVALVLERLRLGGA